ncbi:flagellar hook-length control protein FliK [Dyella sp. A6]|uniref:flagellar hook-length control protein FliK n=1 Tax=Dyella aluminiiresistens TaxID=3069105 RepID=UPI002E77ED02|nr:flagellar hook-length control protein FliK [Dyella sp. A6]
MNIQPTSIAALTWAGAASGAGAGADAWRIGSVFSARPMNMSPQGMLVLQIGALTVEAEPPGTQLPPQFQVRVLSLGPQPLLEVIGDVTTSTEQVVGRALRERLPQQNGYAPLLATLTTLARRPMLRQLPPQLRTVLAQLEQSTRTPAEVTQGEGLQQAVRRSGVFMEASLVAPPGSGIVPAEDDWKVALLRLAAVLQDQPRSTAPVYPPAYQTASVYQDVPDTPPPLQNRGLQAQARVQMADEVLTAAAPEEDVARLLPQLRDATHAALSRLEVTQLEASTLPAWMIEIPIQGDRGYDILQLRIDPGAGGLDEVPGSGAWTLGFAIDLPALGPVHGELQLRGLRLSVRLWARHADAVERLERQFARLRERLAGSGLVLDQLSCQHGLPQTAGPLSAMFLKATA